MTHQNEGHHKLSIVEFSLLTFNRGFFFTFLLKISSDIFET